MFSRKSRTVLFFLMAATTGLADITLATQTLPRQEVERTVTEFLVAFGNRDVVKFGPFFAEDATMFFPPSAAAPTGRVQGRSQIEQTFRAIFEKYPSRSNSVTPIRAQDMLVEEFNGIAVVTFHLGTETNRQRRTLVLRRIGSDWRIVHLHGSASGAPS